GDRGRTPQPPAMLFLVAGRAVFPAPGIHHRAGDKPGVLADGLLDLGRDLRILLQELLGVLPALADALAAIGEPSTGLLHHPGLGADIDELAGLGYALAIHDVELDDPERRRHLVLHHLHPGLAADHRVAILDRADAPDVEAHRGIELQRVAAGGGLGIAEHHPDLHADLVDEDDHAARARDGAC